jgi:hypothetical protein
VVRKYLRSEILSEKMKSKKINSRERRISARVGGWEGGALEGGIKGVREGSSYTDKNLVAGSDSGIYSPSVLQRQPSK